MRKHVLEGWIRARVVYTTKEKVGINPYDY
jgi:hypothetical protein